MTDDAAARCHYSGAYLFADPPSYAEACDAAPAPAPRPLVVWTQHYAAEAMPAGAAVALADADAADGSDGGCWARLCRWRRPRATAVTRSGSGAAACTHPS
jgi:hypothetical protein